MSQATQEYRQLAVGTPFGADKLLLTSISGREEISRLFSYQLEMLSEDAALRAADIVGKNVTFLVRRDDGSPRYFNGFVRQFSAGPVSRAARYRRYRAEVVPWLWFLTQTADCRIFQHKTAPQIIQQIFQDLGFSDFDVSGLLGSYPERTYCVQYRETDFNFVSRLMEEEGIYYCFRHENGKHLLLLADSPHGYRTSPQATLPYQHTDSFHPTDERLTEWEHRYEFRPGRWAHTDYDFEKPRVNLMANQDTVVPLSGNKDFEVYDYPGGYAQIGEGRRLVKTRIEEEETAYDVALGESTCRALSPGEKFTLAEYPVDAENGQTYAVTVIEHTAEEPSGYETAPADGNGQPAAAQYRNRFTCIPASVPFRPARTTRKPVVEGPQTAVVVGPPGEEIYPDKYGRVKVQFHWDREGKRNENSSCWIRVSQIHAGQGWGHMDIPRIGEEVIVDFLEGDPDSPIITGRVYNAGNMPPFALPGGKTRRGNTTKTYQGGGFNEMSMDDTPGAEQIRIHGQYNMDSVIENNLTENVKVDRTRQVGNNEAVTVGADQQVNVGNNQSTTVGNNIVINAGTSITLRCGAAMIHMNQAGVILIQGTLVSMIGSINANVASPITSVTGAVLLNSFGAINVSTGALEYAEGFMKGHYGGGPKAEFTASGDCVVQGAAVKIN
jgi:type VI secretion system secreted protein VgrG